MTSREIDDIAAAFDVYLNEVLVGHLSSLPDDKSVFWLAEEYMNMKHAPTFSLSLRGQNGYVRTVQTSRLLKLPPFFSNLLPESALREYLAKKAGIGSNREFLLMSLLRDDLPGAVFLRPSSQGKVSEKELSKFVEVQRYRQESGSLRFSLAGVQRKLSAVRNAVGTFTVPAHGMNGSWIVKLPGQAPSITENEYCIMQLARQVGIDVADVHLVETSRIENLPKEFASVSGYSLAVRRFDRNDGERVHIEDFAQVFDVFPDQKYERVSYQKLSEVIWQTMGEHSLLEFIRRLTFCIAIGNADMHLKNWSVIYRDRVKPELSPAYDLLSTVVYPGIDSRLALKLAGRKDMSEIYLVDFERLAAKARLPQQLVTRTVTETLEKVLDLWGSQREFFPDALRASLESHMNELPLIKQISAKNF